MNARMFHAGAAAALLWAGAVRAQDQLQTHDRQQDALQTHDRQQDALQTHDRQRDAVHAAMHDAMQRQMAIPPAAAQMPAEMPGTPGTPDRAAANVVRAREHAAAAQQVREAARDRAMKRGAQDAAVARGGTMHGGAGAANAPGAGMMGENGTAQQGAGMMRTGDMHGGSNGMMPGGGGMMGGGGGGMTGGGGGMMGGTTSGSGTPTTTTAPMSGGPMTK